MASTPRATRENERVAARLSEQQLVGVKYFLLTLNDDAELWDWDFGAWHQPTMGVEFATEQGEVFSATWGEYFNWGFGVDLFDEPMSTHLVPEAAGNWVDVSTHDAWSGLLRTPIDVAFLWNDYGTGQQPCPDALKLSTDPTTAWVITADWQRQNSKTSIQLGADDLLVIFNDKLVEVLGLFDSNRGRTS
ncbi:MAG TPA: hypothetical protein VGL39_13640 [Jatrophihabitantaceae bacterium]|jgi:hypothetical protein